jgi:hypothetical protein
MASWFDGFASKLQAATEQVTERAKNALPLNEGFLEKLTLTTPELAEAQKKLDEEEKRKELIKDCLAGLLPWETRDPERDILVEECKERILKLSKDEGTFKGPYLMPGMSVKLNNDDDVKATESEDDDETVEVEKVKQEGNQETPTEESLDKLAKLEPLPKLLGCFDLDAHVGLIQRILAQDPELVFMQSKLSGGGEREYYFWKNYFFHCAYARYEAGLSIDEIWNDEDPAERKKRQQAALQDQQLAAGTKAEEETITFDVQTDIMPETPSGTAAPEAPKPADNTAEAVMQADDPAPVNNNGSSSVAENSSNDFEKVGPENVDDGFGDDGFDVELDELEAEIARELEE